MAYLALARKWRPKAFSEVVGQQHVVQALSNALDTGRVHHAFLFTGTRGVGKTTLARIFAKSLNCEQGTSAEPCQQCGTCKSIDEGRFVDLIEVDAASRTKVDDTRELLENVQYAPTSGKFKVYLIDEVHMLSGHSFNALLKTLEEPPEHVKFLFATTDPQKLPVTVLSRCLQFNLRAMRPEQVENQMVKILGKEGLEFDPAAIQALAKASDGSMRDGLSLLDQAIAQGGGEVRVDDVHGMLGTIKAEHTHSIIIALLSNDVDQALSVVGDMADNAVDFTVALDEVLMQLYYLSLAQISPSSITAAEVDIDSVVELAKKVEPETLQLFYQIGLISKRDIALAPSLRVGFEMALLRMFAFEPAQNKPSALSIPDSISELVEGQESSVNGAEAEKKTVENGKSLKNDVVEQPIQSEDLQKQDVQKQDVRKETAQQATALQSINEKTEFDHPGNIQPLPDQMPQGQADVRLGEGTIRDNLEQREQNQRLESDMEPNRGASYDSHDGQGPSSLPESSGFVEKTPIDGELSSVSFEAQSNHDLDANERLDPMGKTSSVIEKNVQAISADSPGQQPQAPNHSLIAVTLAGNNEWGELVEQTSLGGMAKELAMNCVADRLNQDRIDLCLAPKLQHLFSQDRFDEIQSAVRAAVNSQVPVKLDIESSSLETPAECLSRLGYEHEEQVRDAMHNDPGVQSLIAAFGATIKENSIKPLSH